MKREELLSKGYTEEQTTEFLNMLHENTKSLQAELSSLKAENVTYVSENTTMKQQLDEINKANLTKEEQLNLRDEELKKKEQKVNEMLNIAKAKDILAPLNLGKEELESLVKTLVTADEKTTVDNANVFLNTFNNMKELTKNKTKEELLYVDAKPSNKDNSNKDTIMTSDKFNSLSYDEQLAFKRENPEEYKSLMNN